MRPDPIHAALRSPLSRLCTLLAAITLLASPALTQDTETDEGAQERILIATVFERPIYADTIQPNAQTIERFRKAYEGEKFDQWLLVQRDRILRQHIFNILATAYRRENGIFVSEAEIDKFLADEMETYRQVIAQYEENVRLLKLQAEGIVNNGGQVTDEHMLQIVEFENKITALKKKNIDHLVVSQKQKQLRADIDRRRAAEALKAWKFNRALHEQFGGRVTVQDLTYRPYQAYASWLKIEEELENFQIHDPALRQAFWNANNAQPDTFLEPFEGMWDKLRWQGSGMP